MPGTSSERLREYLNGHDGTRRLFLTEALYRQQVRYTCDLLDVVDSVADPGTAARITDAIGERLAGPAAVEAAERTTQARRDYEDLVRSASWRPGT